jgi:hypothetical protein
LKGKVKGISWRGMCYCIWTCSIKPILQYLIIDVCMSPVHSISAVIN